MPLNFVKFFLDTLTSLLRTARLHLSPPSRTTLGDLLSRHRNICIRSHFPPDLPRPLVTSTSRFVPNHRQSPLSSIPSPRTIYYKSSKIRRTSKVSLYVNERSNGCFIGTRPQNDDLDFVQHRNTALVNLGRVHGDLHGSEASKKSTETHAYRPRGGEILENGQSR